MSNSLPIICSVQMNSQQNIESNLATVSNAIAEASQLGTQLVVLPENFASMGRQRQTSKLFDEISTHLGILARKHQLYLLAGTLPCPYRPNGAKVANNKLRQTSLLFAPDGSQVARYDKIHLFKAIVNDSHGSYDEGLTFETGTQPTIAPIELNNKTFKLGMMVCFDLRFPALVQKYRQMEADMLTAPAAFTYQTGKAHWQLLLQARALDSQCMVVGAAQGGKHIYADGSVRETWGHSTIVDAQGQILATHNNCEVKQDKKYHLVITKFDADTQNTIRSRLPTFNCRQAIKSSSN